MNTPDSLPDTAAQVTENGFLFDDWAPSEQSAATIPCQFEGKIIARMPDLGSECVVESNEKPSSRPFWGRIASSISTSIQGTTPPAPLASLRLFQRITAFGCVVILCGLGIILLEQGGTSPKNTTNTTEMVLETIKIPTSEVGNEMVSAPVLQPELATVTPNALSPPEISDVPTESLASTPISPPSSPEQAETVWNRPASDPYSPWNVAQRQSEGPSTGIAAVESSPIPSAVPATPSNTVSMAPMVDMSMPVSPYEQQWLAQSNPAPTQAPVDPFAQAMQANGQVPYGGMPSQNRSDYGQGTVVSPNTQQRVPPPPYPQYVPTSAVQGVHPPYQHGQNQYGQAIPPNVPIPSGVSTLPSQGGGYYPQYPGAVTPPVPPHPSNYYNVPQTYRRVY